VANPAKARELLKEAGYDGTPIVVMRPTDLSAITELPLAAKQLEAAPASRWTCSRWNWASLVARRAKKEAAQPRRLEHVFHHLDSARHWQPFEQCHA
jgi:peptide/nickel transport system substrate-binding protein